MLESAKYYLLQPRTNARKSHYLPMAPPLSDLNWEIIRHVILPCPMLWRLLLLTSGLKLIFYSVYVIHMRSMKSIFAVSNKSFIPRDSLLTGLRSGTVKQDYLYCLTEFFQLLMLIIRWDCRKCICDQQVYTQILVFNNSRLTFWSVFSLGG